jgi:hypothetical protein
MEASIGKRTVQTIEEPHSPGHRSKLYGGREVQVHLTPLERHLAREGRGGRQAQLVDGLGPPQPRAHLHDAALGVGLELGQAELGDGGRLGGVAQAHRLLPGSSCSCCFRNPLGMFCYVPKLCHPVKITTSHEILQRL